MIHFKPLITLKKGEILNTLQMIYSEYKEINISQYLEWETSWKAYDEFVFNHPDTVGRAGFTTFYNNTFVGFCSWDPRKAPDEVIVGHNGIIPQFRGNGFGVRQINEMIERFNEKRFKKVVVWTGGNDFFAPARKMYSKSGFIEAGKKTEKGMACIYYEFICKY